MKNESIVETNGPLNKGKRERGGRQDEDKEGVCRIWCDNRL